METTSLKALAQNLLNGNHQRNSKETPSFPEGNRDATQIFDRIERNYFALLERFYEIDDDTQLNKEQKIEEARQLVVQLDDLFKTLRREGRMVPVRPLSQKNKQHS